jgi:hypothetical protein
MSHLTLDVQNGASVPVEDMLSKGLSDAVNCVFSQSVNIPFSGIKINSVSQESQPIPAKWHTEVALEDEGVFFEANESEGLETATEGTSWNGRKFFEAASARLGLSLHDLTRLADNEDDVIVKYGPGLPDLVKAKKMVKNELKDYDNLFKVETGREPSRADKEPMRLLYTLYRKIRDVIVRFESNPSPSVQIPSPTIAQSRVSQERMALEERLDVLYREKQELRAVLHEYQNKFVQEQGRRIKYHRDIVAIDREYRQYKQVKEEIAKLENQLGKTPPSRKQSGSDFFI